ncbi:MAG: hypothetical protein IT423_19145 [Pirellulaceae bacterium]|nr:hypothetical protein [Pirellulaceae bacterium]
MPSRVAGPLNQDRHPTSIHDGTHVLSRSEPSGYLCATSHPDLLDRVDQLRRAILAAEQKTGPAIRRHTGEEFQMLVDGLVPGLLIALAGLMATTVIGGTIGAFFGGVGAAPGAAIGFQVGILLLNYLGIGFLAYYVIERIDQVMDAFGRGCRIAWYSCGDSQSIDAAANEFAEGVGIFFRLVLQAMVIYLLKAASDAKVSAAIRELSESRLFRSAPKLREWLLANYRRLAEKFGMSASIENAVEFVPANIRSYTYDMINNPGPLAPGPTATVDAMRRSAAGNFIGGKYNEMILTKPTVLYRAQPGAATVVTIGAAGNTATKLPTSIGRWFAPTPPPSGAIARIDSALKHFWIDVDGVFTGSSSAEIVLAVRIPAGTKVYYGPVGSQGSVYVGGMDKIQVFIPNLSEIKGVQIITETQIQAARTQGVINALQNHGR